MPHLLLILLCLLALPVRAAGIEGLVFVPSKQVSEVAVIDTRTDTVVRRLPTGSAPLHAAVSASLRLLVTTSWRGDTVNLIDIDGILPTQRIALDLRPDGIELDPAGRLLAVSSLETDNVALVDLVRRRQTASLAGFAMPHHLAFLADGRRLLVGNLGANRVTEVDVAAATVARQIELAPADTDLGGVTNLAVLPDGRRALAAFGSGSELALLDLVEGAAGPWVSVGELPWHAFATMDGSRLLVPNNGEGTVSLLDGTSLTEIARIPAGADITGVNTGWFETVAFVLSRGDRKATAIDLERGRLLGEIGLPGAPEAGVTTADGTRLYVALGDVGGVAVIDVRERRLLKVIDGVARRPWGVQMAGALNYCR
jgi:DNA-binding beta-propeller fold protein YncE